MPKTKTLAKQPQTPVEAYQTAMGFIRQAMNVIDDLIRANPDDLEGLVRTDAVLEQIGADVKTIRSEAKRFATALLLKGPKDAKGKHNQVVEGLGRVKLVWKAKRTWNDEQVEAFLLTVVKRAAEKAERDGDNVDRAVVRALRAAMKKTEPKVTALNAYSIDPDHISTSEWGDPDFEVDQVVGSLIPNVLKSGDAA